MNLFTMWKESHGCRNKFIVTKRWGGRDKLGGWNYIYTLLYIK